jgi:hypothetical protein
MSNMLAKLVCTRAGLSMTASAMRSVMANYRFSECEATAKTDPLTQRVDESLRTDIVADQFAPGDRLVRRGPSKRRGVSPMPITEAL